MAKETSMTANLMPKGLKVLF